MNDRFAERVKVAKQEAKRFLEKVKGWEAAQYGNKDSAAMKRASMDLTRALADVRRSPFED